MITVGITGHQGFVGSNLVKFIQHEGIYTPYLWDGDLNSTGGQDYYLSNLKRCDVIVHLAGKNKGSPEELVKTNSLGTLDLIHFCKEAKRPLIIAGAEYDKQNVYKDSKDFIKLSAKIYSYLGLGSMVLDIPKVIGPGCKPFYNSFVSTLIYLKSINELDKNMHLIKDLNESVKLIHTRDLCEVICDNINYAVYNHGFDGFMEYQFRKEDGVFEITFGEIIDILNGNKEHKQSYLFLSLLEWYKNNASILQAK